MIKYKVGDKVRVRSDLKTNERYYTEGESYNDVASEKMVSFSGKIVTISDYGEFGYNILEDDEYHFWIDGMFEGLVEDVPVEKPLLGILPKQLHREFRADNLIAAMLRYREHGKKIPRKWFTELVELSDYITGGE